MALLTYVPAQIDVTVAGFINIAGFAQGSFVEIRKDISPYQMQSSMDGQTSRTFVYDANYTVVVTLAQSSESNNDLNTLHALDLASQLGKVPLMIRDKSGSTTFFSPSAWIENYPEIVFSGDLESRKWTFKCSDCVLTVGGSGDSNLLNQLAGLLPGAANILGGL